MIKLIPDMIYIMKCLSSEDITKNLEHIELEEHYKEKIVDFFSNRNYECGFETLFQDFEKGYFAGLPAPIKMLMDMSYPVHVRMMRVYDAVVHR